MDQTESKSPRQPDEGRLFQRAKDIDTKTSPDHRGIPGPAIKNGWTNAHPAQRLNHFGHFLRLPHDLKKAGEKFQIRILKRKGKVLMLSNLAADSKKTMPLNSLPPEWRPSDPYQNVLK